MTSRKCTMCSFFALDEHCLLLHVVRKHRHEPRFMVHCNAHGCTATFSKYESFRKHVKRNHYVYDELDGINHEDVQECRDNDHEKGLNNSQAAFLLNLKVKYGLSIEAIDYVITSVRDLTEIKLDDVTEKLKKTGTVLSDRDVANVFSTKAMFEHVNSENKRDSYFTKEFNFVHPIPVILGEKFVTRRFKNNTSLRKVNVVGYYVPFLQSLAALLSMPEVDDLVFGANQNYKVQDVQDGSYLQNHDFFRCNPNALLFSLYVDDFEIANPIGTHRTVHKLTVFYYQLLNIPPIFRSKLSTIQLLAIAKSVDLKKYQDGTEKLLSNFIEGLNLLKSGVSVVVGTREVEVKGMLVYVTADTLAAQSIGGFKEGVGNAKKPCRTCEITSDSLTLIHMPSQCVLRDEQEHHDRCHLLETLSEKARIYWSMQFGVVKRTFLCDIPYFSVTQCILHDSMHILLEGIDRIEIGLILYHVIIEEKIIRLDWLNRAISNFNYTSEEMRDKPPNISNNDLISKSVTGQTAVSMKILMFILPLLIGSKIPSDNAKWQNFIKLLQINILCQSAVVSDRSYNSLIQLIYDHNTNFIKLYPDHNFVPKMHYMLHLPNQMRQFGPLRNQWCLHFEGKHALFKRKKWRNFKNIPKSLAEFHQRWMCMSQISSSGERSLVYLYEGDRVESGNVAELNTLPENLLLQKLLNITDDEIVYLCNRVTLCGHQYVVGNILVTSWEVLGEPELAKIYKIIVLKNEKYFLCKKLIVKYFDSHINCFYYESDQELVIVKPRDLIYMWPQISRTYHGEHCVMLCNVDEVWTY